AIAAATVSFAFEENTTPKAIALKAIEMSKTLKSKVEGESWQSWDMYECVANEMENKVKEIIKLVEEKGFDAIDDIVKLASKDFFADGAETLILAIAAFVMSNGEFSLCMEICRKMLRDCDSSGAVAGGICGAFCGILKIPQEWITLVETCNQEKTMFDYAKEMENIIVKNNDKTYCNAVSIKTLANS
ncbi:MAG: ADP-ribosylglycohydrolase family protein, partial [Clostridia bacterium]